MLKFGAMFYALFMLLKVDQILIFFYEVFTKKLDMGV